MEFAEPQHVERGGKYMELTKSQCVDIASKHMEFAEPQHVERGGTYMELTKSQWIRCYHSWIRYHSCSSSNDNLFSGRDRLSSMADYNSDAF